MQQRKIVVTPLPKRTFVLALAGALLGASLVPSPANARPVHQRMGRVVHDTFLFANRVDSEQFDVYHFSDSIGLVQAEGTKVVRLIQLGRAISLPRNSRVRILGRRRPRFASPGSQCNIEGPGGYRGWTNCFNIANR